MFSFRIDLLNVSRKNVLCAPTHNTKRLFLKSLNSFNLNSTSQPLNTKQREIVENLLN